MDPRESRLNGKSKEAVETNAKIAKLLLAVNAAFDSLVKRKNDFNATDVKEMLQGSKDTQNDIAQAVRQAYRGSEVPCGDRHIPPYTSKLYLYP